MRDRTRLDVDAWWRAVFDVQDGLWWTLTVLHTHRVLYASGALGHRVETAGRGDRLQACARPADRRRCRERRFGREV